MSDVRLLTVLGRRIEYRRVGPVDARTDVPVIVMLHEGLGSLGLWKDFPRDLAAITGLPVVAYSRFGYGGSEAPPHYAALEMHRREALEVLPELLQRLEISRPVLFGHSDGASIALIYAGAVPKAVSGLVLLAPHVFVEDICLTSISRAKQAYLTSNMRQKLGRYHADPDCAFWLWNNVWLDTAFQSWNIEHVLPRIECPVLVIQGQEDEYGTMAQLDRIARGIQQSEQLRLDHCRHSPHRDQPVAVLQATARWVQQHPSIIRGAPSKPNANPRYGAA